MRRMSVLPLCLVFTCGAAPARADTGDSEAPPGRLGDLVRPTAYRIELTIDPDAARFSGTAEIDVVLSAPAGELWLHGKDLDVAAVTAIVPGGNAVSAGYRQVLPSGVSLVEFAAPVDAGSATLRFDYSAAFSQNLLGLYTTSRGDRTYVATQFQPLGARQVFPSFDEPRFKVPFDISLVVPDGYAAVTATDERSATPVDDGFVRYEYHRTRPLPTYLIAFAVGPYDVNVHDDIAPSEYRRRPIPLRGLAAAGQGQRLDAPLAGTEPILTMLENYFGLPYPYRKLDLIAVPANFGGAMENVGAIIYDEWLLLVDSDSPVTQRRWYVLVHAHELAHQWFGNLVTPAWWDDIWLNESFASWIAYRTGAEYWPEGGFDRWLIRSAMSAMATDSVSSAQAIRKPVVTNEQVDSAFDSITYRKGGMVLAMFERYFGEETFRDGIRYHLKRFENGVATAQDFIESLAEASDDPRAIEAFRRYVTQPGIPLIDVDVQCARGEAPALNIRQFRYAPLGSRIRPDEALWLIPMCAAIGRDGSTGQQCHLVDQRTQRIELPAGGCPDVVHPNPGGTGYYRFSLSDTYWQALLAGIDDMTAVDAVSVGDSLRASFRAGRVTADLYARGLAALLRRDEWDLVYFAAGESESLLQTLDARQSMLLKAELRAIVKPRVAAFAGGEDVNDVMMRWALSNFLIGLDDPELLRSLAVKAAAYVGFDGEPDPSALEPDQLQAALSAGVKVLGNDFFDHLLAELLESNDAAFRNAAVSALAVVEDESRAARLHAAILDRQITDSHAVSVLYRRFADPASRDASFRWLSANAGQVLELLPDFFRASMVVPLGAAFCDRGRVGDWRTFVVENAGSLAGYEQPLSETLETIEVCAALRDNGAGEVIAAFESLGS
ncbi:MAG: M1 family metallopeptidase [Woeseiaceae bacterium]|nr:M1 family metallopeptidase [Woeseiaceae bacterium]